MRDDSGLVNGSRGVVVGFEAMIPGAAEHGWESNEFHARLDVTEELPLVKFAGFVKVCPCGQCWTFFAFNACLHTFYPRCIAPINKSS